MISEEVLETARSHDTLKVVNEDFTPLMLRAAGYESPRNRERANSDEVESNSPGLTSIKRNSPNRRIPPHTEF